MTIAGILLLIFIAYCWCRIAHKAGYQPWLGLLFLVPVVNLVFLGWFAFAAWPVHARDEDDSREDPPNKD